MAAPSVVELAVERRRTSRWTFDIQVKNFPDAWSIADFWRDESLFTFHPAWLVENISGELCCILMLNFHVETLSLLVGVLWLTETQIQFDHSVRVTTKPVHDRSFTPHG